MLTREEYNRFKAEMDKFLRTFEKVNPEETFIPAYRVRQFSYLYLMTLEDCYTEKENELPAV